MALKDAKFVNAGMLKEIKKLSMALEEAQTKITALVTLTTELKTEHNTLVTEVATLGNELKADFNAHVHSGITAGAANSGVSDLQIAAADVTASAVAAATVTV